MSRRPLSAGLLAGLVAACSDDGPRQLPGGPADNQIPHTGAVSGGGKTPGDGAGGSGGMAGTGGTGGDLGPPQGCAPEDQEEGAMACVAQPYTAQPPPLVLYLMIDRSGSMSDSTGTGASKWQALGQALNSFLDSPPLTNLSVAAQLFPQPDGEICSPDAYAFPLINLAPVATVKGAVTSMMASWEPGGSTPTAPALQGAIDQARRWARDQPKSTVAVVLATDGQPSSCEPIDAAGLSVIAAEGARASTGKPAIPTFVIGMLGINDFQSGAVGLLDTIAQSGNTGSATLVNASSDLAQQMSVALRAVATRSVECSFEIPPMISQVDDLSLVNVRIESASCDARRLSYIPWKQSCAGDGWTYDSDPALGVLPGKIQLCSVSCERYRNGDTISIEVGCATKGWPPK